LGRPSLRRRLEAYYQLINPDSIANSTKWRETFAQIYEKYGGSYEGEQKLANKLAKKYGTTVRLLLAKGNDDMNNNNNNDNSRRMVQQAASASSKSINNNNALPQRDESWFQLSPSSHQQNNSGVLDMTNPNFDPLAALRESKALVIQSNPWISKCPILNYTDKFRSLLPTNDPLYRPEITSSNTTKKRKGTTNNNDNSNNNDDNDDSDRPRSKKLGVFAALAEQCKTGPFLVLHTLLSERHHRIRVVIRYVNGVRGTLTGYLIAYDKHFNMILRDVDEVYCPRNTDVDVAEENEKSVESDATSDVKNDKQEENQSTGTEAKKAATTTAIAIATATTIPPSNTEIEMKRRTEALMQTRQKRPNSGDKPEWKVRQRHMKKLMVRGDNVVLVYKAESERSAWPQSSKSPQKSVHGRKGAVVTAEERVGTPGALIYALQRQQQQQQQQEQSRQQGRTLSRYDHRQSKT